MTYKIQDERNRYSATIVVNLLLLFEIIYLLLYNIILTRNTLNWCLLSYNYMR